MIIAEFSLETFMCFLESLRSLPQVAERGQVSAYASDGPQRVSMKWTEYISLMIERLFVQIIGGLKSTHCA